MSRVRKPYFKLLLTPKKLDFRKAAKHPRSSNQCLLLDMCVFLACIRLYVAYVSIPLGHSTGSAVAWPSAIVFGASGFRFEHQDSVFCAYKRLFNHFQFRRRNRFTL